MLKKVRILFEVDVLKKNVTVKNERGEKLEKALQH